MSTADAGAGERVEAPQLAACDLTQRLGSREEYKQRRHALQLQMLRIQQTYYFQRRRAIVVFQGWDAAGKGGCIRRLTRSLDPRGYRVHAIGPPDAEEQGHHYLQRFWTRLPPAGHLTIFDRSWYERVLAERVHELASRAQWSRAYAEINAFERMLVDDGVRLVKLFLHISPEEQLERFRERIENPYKRWKMSREDVRNRKHWDAYAKAADEMFARTSTAAAPWLLIPAEAKWYARIAVLETVVGALTRDLELLAPYDEAELAQVRKQLEEL